MNSTDWLELEVGDVVEFHGYDVYSRWRITEHSSFATKGECLYSSQNRITVGAICEIFYADAQWSRLEKFDWVG